MKRIIKLSILLTFLICNFAQAQITGNRPLNLNSPDDISYLDPKNYVIGGVTVTGAQYLDAEVLITISKLSVGQYIEVPSEQTSSVIKALMDQNLFEDVQLYATKIEDETIYLEIRVVERPRLTRVDINGLSKTQTEEVRKRLNTNSGKIVNDNLLMTTKTTIEKYLREKSYLFPEIKITTKPDSSQANNEILVVDVDRNKKIKVNSINFTGNEEFSNRQLTKFMKGVRPRAWFRVFGPGKFKDEKYEEAKTNLIAKMQDKGFRDAQILKDTVRRHDNNEVAIDIDVYEGPKYYVGNITWSGNSKFKDSTLNILLGIQHGDVYSEEKLNSKLSGPTRNSDDIAAIYQNDGYLTFSVQPVIRRIYQDTVDLEIQMFEGKQYTINNVILKGNDVTNDRVVLRSIYTKPGQKYSRELLVRSVREISQLGMFDEQKVQPMPTNLNYEEGTTDIEFSVAEKPSDQVELSGGYGAGQVIGTLGLTFNNFSTSNFFKKESWKPLPRGDGQKLSIRGQTSGKRYQSYSFSFSEPWLGGKKPIYFGLSAYISNSQYQRYNWQNNRYEDYEGIPKIQMHGVTATLGKRLQWPDNYFQINSSLSYQRYFLDNYGGIFVFADGTAYNINFTQEISRNSIDAPIYPTSGSHIKFSVQLTPPYSLWNNINYATAPDNEKYKFTEYHKWKFDSQWYTKIAGKLVFKAQAQFGYLGSYGNETPISPFERFKLGGDGMQGFDFLQGSEIIAMRGYSNGALIPASTGSNLQNIAIQSGSPIYAKYQIELRHPIMLNEQATVFALAFAEAGNTWNKFDEVNPFKVRRSVGVGARIFLPIFGMLGIDYGHALDPIPGLTTDRWKQNFTFSIIQNMGGF
ncbi:MULTISPECIES: outer membrane protein assembly factor BamA [Sphingobacterium]|uniref:Outer membrane protein assembly factor BamA n=1 Tax=Sphingobacterium cellulitidis TaxID=1768011 RepID=A0A8H9KVS2_9SPHI|nr:MULTISPECIES: outer membrane protein assembly factor BamA [Sphingobacterium]MBA8988603.1 outer membrane protein insertion porin family [Sphingobacterium soli]OYD43228.1 outer membrane protein assembly factor BamA [Sphingobacterium cellulitidis]OYD47433.1 outer membrane protein assembly factor BamA [Sphingobacterium cellulitidis]WFB62621.1 outer membrane protein assembly factor BamA [Sphingobacterium sp. WM]GGE34120.1 outer membrane protein assembly factor [Sphingobacterium soli]